MFDILFEWHPIGQDKILDNLVKNITDKIENSRKSLKSITRETRKNEKKIATHLINALYISNFSFPASAVSINLTAKNYSGKQYGYKNVIKVYEAIQLLDWITIKKGTESSGKVTRISPSKKLKNLFNEIGFRWRYYPPDKDKEFIVLRDRVKNKNKKKKYKKITLPLPQSDFTAKEQRALLSFNQFISHHCIALDVSNKQIKTIIKTINEKTRTKPFWFEEPQHALNYSLTHLRRIFARGKLNLGGRFYGVWWQSLPAKFRPHITIDGKKTVELDYSTMSLRLLYAREGIEIDAKRDLYDLGLSGTTKYLKDARDLIKIYINAILNDDGGRYRLTKQELTTLKLSHYQLQSLVNTYHKPISHLFGTGIGIELMFLDSILAQRLMTWFQHQGIVLLPIHDSFIINSGYEMTLKNQMQIEYQRLMKKYIKVKSSGTKIREYFNKDLPLEIQPKEQIIGSKQLYDLVFNDDDNDIYSRYLSSWYSWISS
tara:strand:+ start:31 stop:1491 length:1461 start_codon:yes stop_codon:yes gene_type:complete